MYNSLLRNSGESPSSRLKEVQLLSPNEQMTPHNLPAGLLLHNMPTSQSASPRVFSKALAHFIKDDIRFDGVLICVSDIGSRLIRRLLARIRMHAYEVHWNHPLFSYLPRRLILRFYCYLNFTLSPFAKDHTITKK